MFVTNTYVKQVNNLDSYWVFQAAGFESHINITWRLFPTETELLLEWNKAAVQYFTIAIHSNSGQEVTYFVQLKQWGNIK